MTRHLALLNAKPIDARAHCMKEEKFH